MTPRIVLANNPRIAAVLVRIAAFSNFGASFLSAIITDVGAGITIGETPVSHTTACQQKIASTRAVNGAMMER